MNAGALSLVDHVLPDVPLRQFVVTVPFPLRFPLAFDGKLMGQVLRIFIDTVAANYRKRLAERGVPGGKHGAVAVIQRANSDLRCNPHVHAIFLDELYAPDREGARKARGVGRRTCGPEVPEGVTARASCATLRRHLPKRTSSPSSSVRANASAVS